jgi:hypothetical protein
VVIPTPVELNRREIQVPYATAIVLTSSLAGVKLNEPLCVTVQNDWKGERGTIASTEYAPSRSVT